MDIGATPSLPTGADEVQLNHFRRTEAGNKPELLTSRSEQPTLRKSPVRTRYMIKPPENSMYVKTASKVENIWNQDESATVYQKICTQKTTELL